MGFHKSLGMGFQKGLGVRFGLAFDFYPKLLPHGANQGSICSVLTSKEVSVINGIF